LAHPDAQEGLDATPRFYPRGSQLNGRWPYAGAGVKSSNFTLLNTFAGEVYERFNNNALELVHRKVDVIVAVTRLAAVAAQRATSTIPIVFVVVPNPIKSGLIDSFARPGKNITGLSNVAVDLAAKRLEIFKEIVPSMSKLALLVNATDPGGTFFDCQQ
jgi:ABC transporter substrate binding protein